MITFIINNQLVSSEIPAGISLLDFIRYETDLPGTKVGCREGDCGACTVIQGTLHKNKITYKSIVSCLTPLGNVHGKHIVTIEGLNMEHLSPVQKAIVNNNATQCGFCTPGFVMSLTSYCLSEEKSAKKEALASISGNICRCTGYKTIEKAADDITGLLKNKSIEDPVSWLVNQRFLPDYFLGIPERLSAIENNKSTSENNEIFVAGGTDLMVREADELAQSDINLLQYREDLNGISIENGKCIIGAASTISDIEHSSIINDSIPGISSYFKLIASEQVRNMGTIAGNIANASPVGDITILFLALNADVITDGPDGSETIPLREFFQAYKKINIKETEIIKSVAFTLPEKSAFFNFEKVSRRTHLDIASVNSAIQIMMHEDKIMTCYISAGGVSPIPLFLGRTCTFLTGKTITRENILQADAIMQEEIFPISDVRGSKEYKRLLLRQILYAHFIKLFPGILTINDVNK